VTTAATWLGMRGAARAQSSTARSAEPPSRGAGTSTSLTVKQIDAGLLNVGYAEAGPGNGRPAILLNGWPYDIHSEGLVLPVGTREEAVCQSALRLGEVRWPVDIAPGGSGWTP